jgi:prepilin-type N-terminal cleavage/methylation domain-containing protein
MKRRGFTLTEMAIVLCVLGLVLAAVWAAASAVIARQRVEQGVDQVWIISQNIRNLYTGQQVTAAPPVTGGPPSLVCSGVFPTDTLQPSTTGTACQAQTPYNPWGGTITAGFVFYRGFSTSNTFYIMSNMPTIPPSNSVQVCMDIISRLPGTGTLVAGGSPTAPSVLPLPLDTTQGKAPTNVYVSNGSWQDVTGLSPTNIISTYFAVGQTCAGAGFLFVM